MRSKNSKAITDLEASHLERVKQQICSICDAPGPSEAHHIEQGLHFTTVALCSGCHTGAFNGIHGQKRAWMLRKMTELDALNVTLKRIFQA